MTYKLIGFKLSPHFLLAFSFLIFSSSTLTLSSRITFEYGLYQNVLVAINPDIHPENCMELVKNITNAFQIASSYLHNATNQRSNFGIIKLLLPSNWGSDIGLICGDIPIETIVPSKQFEVYDNADFKITSNHPFTPRLPWTKQYKDCENESETVFIPLVFLTNPEPSTNFRGRLLFHEWAKLRYGVFEEMGYFNDPIYSPCYRKEGKVYYTGCTDVEIRALVNSTSTEEISPDDCRLLLEENKIQLIDQLKFANSSIMFSPHLENINQFCIPDANIGLSPTKHNVQCERRSVSDIVFSHKDFKLDEASSSFFPNTRRRTKQIVYKAPVVQLVRRAMAYDQGYAFLIEHDETARAEGRLLQIKQAMSIILNQAKSSSHICVSRFEGSVFTSTCDVNKLETESDRVRLLGRVPGPESLRIIEQLERSGRGRSNHFNWGSGTNKKSAVSKIIEDLEKYPQVHWNVIIISSSPPGNLPQIIDTLKSTAYSLSILTLDSSVEWLEFNKLTNFRKLMYTPKCNIGEKCNDVTVPLLVDHFNELVRTNSSSQKVFIQKVIDFTYELEDGSNSGEQSFTITSLIKNVENFHLYMLVNVPDRVTVTLKNGAGRTCSSASVLNYPNAFAFNTVECPYQTGTWTVSVVSEPTNNQTYFNLIGYGEVRMEEGIEIDASLGRGLSSPVFPTVQPTVPVYVSVETFDNKPILNASVELRIHRDNIQYNETMQRNFLIDNGNYPDLTQNDGVYSGFIMNFNKDPSYHTGQILVRTIQGESKSLLSIGTTNGAGLLDSLMETKCCGSAVAINLTQNLGPSAYVINLPAFRTGESFAEDLDILPPAKISSLIRTNKNTNIDLDLEFIAPGSDLNGGPPLAYYEICCTNSSTGNLNENLCRMISTQDCSPVSGGEVQNCLVSKLQIAKEFFNMSTIEDGLDYYLYCGIRGVDAGKNRGPLSSMLLEINLDLSELARIESGSCKSLSDDCLPVEVFWGLIGCIGGLICLLFIVFLCWCCSGGKKSRSKTLPPSTSLEEREATDHSRSLQNVYINQAYIQDTNGQLRMVASDGELLSLGNSNNEFEMRLNGSAANLNKRSSKSLSPEPMKVTNYRQVSFPHTEPSSPLPVSTFSSNNPNYRVPIIRKSEVTPTNSQSRLNIPRLSPTVATISGRIDAEPDQLDNEHLSSPVYASVNRFPRRSPSPIRVNHNRAPRPATTVQHNLINPQPPEIPQRPHTMAGHDVSAAKKVVRPYIVKNPTLPNSVPIPPVRLDHFPSSESEIYSDMSLIVNQQPGKNMTSKRQSSKPSGILHEDIIKRSMEIQRPRATPPPPPPPRQRTKSTDRERPISLHHNPIVIGRVEQYDDVDDDSDYWDSDEEELDNNKRSRNNSSNNQLFSYNPPGTSFA